MGIGAASGVTFDLLAMREEYGAEAVHTFTCFAGRACFDISPGQSTAYIIYSNENEILQDPYRAR